MEEQKPQGLFEQLKKEAVKDKPSRFMTIYFGVGVIVAFLFLVSLAPQIGEKLGTLSVKKQLQKSYAYTNTSPSPAPQPASPCSFTYGNKTYGYGDVNLNGYVDSVDALFTQKMVAGLFTPISSALAQAQIIAAHVTGTPQTPVKITDIAPTDADKILQYVAGTIKTFPVCPIRYPQ